MLPLQTTENVHWPQEKKKLWWTHSWNTFTSVCNSCLLYIVRDINAECLSIQGDSGGPVVSRNSSLWIQSGIVSFGVKKCDDPKYPSVFARVSQYQEWITSNIGSNPPGFVKYHNSGFRSSLNLLLFSISLTFSIIPFTFSLYLSS